MDGLGVGISRNGTGAAGWLSGRPPTEYGINEYGSPGTERSAFASWISRAALVVGVVTVVLGAAVVHSSPVGLAVTIGLGGMTAVCAVWCGHCSRSTPHAIT